MGVFKSRRRSAAEVPSPPGCVDPARSELMTRYCFGDATEGECSSFEKHILQCDSCWREVQQLASSVTLLRIRRDLKKSLLTPGTIGVLGISGRLDHALGGHLWMMLGISVLYALLFALSFVFEVTYEFDHFGMMAVSIASLGVFPGIVATSLLGLGVDCEFTRGDRRHGLWISITIAVGAVALLVVAASWFLPNRPITLMNVQAYPAPAAFIKDAFYYVPLWVLFVVIPYHSVITFQRELRHGHARQVLDLLCGEKTAFSPRGCITLRVWHLGCLLGMATLASFYLTTNLLNNVRPAPFMNLFVTLIQVRTLCYFVLGTGTILWYSSAINEIKRECAAVLSLQHDRPAA